MYVQTGFSTGSEESGGNGSSEFVCDGSGQAKNTSKQDESRGTQVRVCTHIPTRNVVMHNL